MLDPVCPFLVQYMRSLWNEFREEFTPESTMTRPILLSYVVFVIHVVRLVLFFVNWRCEFGY